MLEEFKHLETKCACNICMNMCKNRSCWGTPQELLSIIDADFGSKLMLDYWSQMSDDIFILCGAMKGFEGKRAPWWPQGQCTFQTDLGLCVLHDKNIKPMEGRVMGCGPRQNLEVSRKLHRELAMSWDTKEGRKIVRDWKKNI